MQEGGHWDGDDEARAVPPIGSDHTVTMKSKCNDWRAPGNEQMQGEIEDFYLCTEGGYCTCQELQSCGFLPEAAP
jgi:hypothetical protein